MASEKQCSARGQSLYDSNSATSSHSGCKVQPVIQTTGRCSGASSKLETVTGVRCGGGSSRNCELHVYLCKRYTQTNESSSKLTKNKNIFKDLRFSWALAWFQCCKYSGGPSEGPWGFSKLKLPWRS